MKLKNISFNKKNQLPLIAHTHTHTHTLTQKHTHTHLGLGGLKNTKVVLIISATIYGKIRKTADHP